MRTEQLTKSPLWVVDEALIQRLLNRFIDKIDKQQTQLSVRMTPKNAPELFDFESNEAHYLWGLIEDLESQFQILQIKKQRPKQGVERYENAQIYFNKDKEDLVRLWLNRPVLDAYTLTWSHSLSACAHCFEDNGRALLTSPIRKKGKEAKEILDGFVKVGDELRATDSPLTLRCLSARCFWGDSKFLDNRGELIHGLFPDANQYIKPRPILMTVYIPESFEEVLFVENQDSFLALVEYVQCHTQLNYLAIVYSAGFRGSAMRIRHSGHALFTVINPVEPCIKNRFEQWWFVDQDPIRSCYFWGDLDYSAMAILMALRKSFHNIQAWSPGYRAMLEYHGNGIGHLLEDTGKEEQKDLGDTGCDYADETLLPLMRKSEKFVDQEIVAIADLF